MAISNTASRNTYTLDSVTTDFDITFDCVFDDNGDATELTVWLIDSEGNRTEVTKGYASDQYTTAYKTVTYLDATSHAGETLLISRATPRTQLMDFVNNGAYNLNQVEAMSDKLTRIVQEQDDTIADRIQTGAEYAESAKESAEAALASEQNAKTSEDNAKESEDNAKESEDNAKDSEDNAKDSAEDSEAWAVGKRNGQDVPPTDPTYHNSSKYYHDLITQIISGAMRYQGIWTTTGQTDYSSLTTPRLKGDMFYCQGSATTIDGVTYTQGDLIIFNTDVADGDTILTSMVDHVDNTESLTPDNLATLTNKTIDAKDNTIVCTATSITTSQTLTPTKQMMVTIDDTVTLTLGSGSYIGQELPVLAQTTCDVSYTGQDGASVDNLNAGDYITYVWQGTYWIVDASTYIKPTYISTSQTVTPTKAMLLVIDTTSVVLTLGNGMYDGFELPVLAQADCSIVYTGVNGTVTETREDGDYNVFVWNDSYWVPKQTTPITGIDDNGQPFAFNIDSMVREKGVINLTGTDANGNPFDYGLGRLVTNADEDNIVTGQEIKTSKTYNGKPIYLKESSVAVSTIDTASQFSDFFPATMDKIVSLNVLEDLTNGVTLTNGVHFSNTEKFWAYHNGGQKLYVYTHWAGTVRVTTEYTKTTDA